jgi:hypothetical protein
MAQVKGDGREYELNRNPSVARGGVWNPEPYANNGGWGNAHSAAQLKLEQYMQMEESAYSYYTPYNWKH